jgi:hypothetical protein
MITVVKLNIFASNEKPLRRECEILFLLLIVCFTVAQKRWKGCDGLKNTVDVKTEPVSHDLGRISMGVDT